MLRHEGERRGEKEGSSVLYAFALMDLLDFILFIFIKIGPVTRLCKEICQEGCDGVFLKSK